MTDDEVGHERAPVADSLRISGSELDGGQKETGTETETEDKGDSVWQSSRCIVLGRQEYPDGLEETLSWVQSSVVIYVGS